jgi:AcrR family transcriptional regulator
MPQPARKIQAARGERTARRGVGPLHPAGRPTQRQRLIEAIVELSGSHGYQGLSIAQISSRAGVSSATFYELFEDKEACMLAAYRDATARTLARMESALEEGEWARAARPAFGELLQSVQSDPDAGRVMFVEAPSGGPRLREELAMVLDLMEQSSEALLDGALADTGTLDVPARALIGGVRYIVSRHLRTHEEDRLTRVTDDIISWMGSYAVPAERGRWSIGPEAFLAGGAAPSAGAQAAEVALGLPRLPRGRHGLSPGAVARSQRTRIILATAQVTMDKGYANTTVADIVAAAGVAKDAFYRHFSDREQAFLEAQQYPSQHILDTMASAYFSADRWPERVWRALDALLGLIAEHPALAHLRMVECYAAGAASIRRAEDITRSFTLFLEEGYRYGPTKVELPRLYSQSISGALFELIQRDIARGQATAVRRRLPQLAYVAIAPFAGPGPARELVGEMALREGSAAAGA